MPKIARYSLLGTAFASRRQAAQVPTFPLLVSSPCQRSLQAPTGAFRLFHFARLGMLPHRYAAFVLQTTRLLTFGAFPINAIRRSHEL